MDFKRKSIVRLNDATKTLWIFGAGASYSPPYKVPVQDKLLDSFGNKTPGGRPRVKEEFIKLRERVENVCKKILPGSTLNDVTLEEVFSSYEIQDQAGWATDDEKKEAIAAIQDLKKMLIRTTGVKGRGDALKFRPHKRAGQVSPYAELLEKLFPTGCNDRVIRGHVLVTMNYDINLDRCVLNMREKPYGEIDLDYGVEFANYRISGNFYRPGRRSVLLLRLHGGLNWKRCLACHALFTTVNSHANVSPRESCGMCGSERLDYVIVYPSFLRNYSDPVLQMVWGRFLEELVSADRWIFIGYSLPPADVNLRVLLRHALKMRTTKVANTSIIWVGKRDNPSDSNWLSLGERFHHLFGDHAAAWENAEDGFEGFVRSL